MKKKGRKKEKKKERKQGDEKEYVFRSGRDILKAVL